MRQVVAFVNEMVALRASSLDTLLQRAQTSLKNGVCPPLSDDELDWSAPALVIPSSSSSSATTQEEDEGEEEDSSLTSEDGEDEGFMFEGEDEGVVEESSSKIPNEDFGSSKQ